LATGVNRRRTLVVAVGAMAAAALVASTMSSAASRSDGTRAPFVRIDPSLLKASGFRPLSLDTTPVQAMVQLDTPPVAAQVADARKKGGDLSDAQQESIRQKIEAAQNNLRGALTSRRAKIVAQLQSAYNGVQVVVPRNQISSIAQLPGVVAVRAVKTFTVGPKNVNGVPFVSAPIAWSYQQTGKHVKIADIDTGLDYTHADFGGPGTVAAYQAADATDTAPADPRLFGPRAPKVKGGYDFVGDAYDANTPGSVPVPDPNPLDCNGHGTHTAGTVAGFGVLDNGKTYKGKYKADTVSSHDWNVGPGVAPEADLYAYRVFGCEGSSNVVDLAIDRAVRDHVDVITMSLGSDFGGVDDPTTVAAENAAAAGITVVAAAGNAGPSGYIVSSPSTGPHVLSVAALDGSLPTYPGAHVSFASGGTVDTIDANGAPLPTGSLPVKVLKNPDGSISLGCDPNEYAGTAGMLVVTKRGTCARVARAVFGQQHGAAAVLMLNNAASLPPYEGPITGNPDTGEAYDVTIPFLGAALTSANQAALLAADGSTATFSPFDIPNTGYQNVASFSSGGPSNPDSAAKPEVIAPGVSVASAGVGTGNGFLVESGTSMATPMTAGIAALVKDAHPLWTGTQIKAAIENTADPSLNDDYNVRQSGAGVVQADDAVTSTVLATTADGFDSLVYGYVPGSGAYSATKTFTLQNTSLLPVTYSLSVDPDASGLGGGNVSVSPSSVTVGPFGSRTVSVTLSYSAAALAALPSAGDSGGIGGTVDSHAGAIVATPSTGSTTGHGHHGLLQWLLHHMAKNNEPKTLRVPFMVVPRGLSNVTAGTPTFSGNTGTVTLTNSGLHEGTADVYAWGITDANDGGQPMDIRDVGIQTFSGAVVGAPSSDRFNVLAINTWGRFTNPSVNEFDVGIDTNRDGTVDYIVAGVDYGAVTTGTFNGQFASFIIDAASGDIVDAWGTTAPMNGSIVELPFLSSDIGQTSASGAFNYTATGFSIVPGTLVDTTGTASWDPYHLTENSGQFLDLAPGASGTIPLAKSPSATQLGWIAVTVDDANGAAQADEIANH
jgi:subtilisin family serine protease